MKKLKLISILVAITLTYGCKKEADTTDSINNNDSINNSMELNENVFILNRETGIYLDSIGNNLLLFNQITEQIDSIQPGDVYVGGRDYNNGFGFIRIVENIEEENGKVIGQFC